jgi:hypothetical protein
MQRFLYLFISINCSTCFRWFLRSSSGAQNCTYSVRYCQTNTATTLHVSGGFSAHHQEHKSVHTASDIVKPILLPAAIVDEMERSSISSTIAAVLVWQYLMLHVQFCAPDDGRRNRLKHVEQFIEINRSRNHCIFLVVLWRCNCDERKYERQIRN